MSGRRLTVIALQVAALVAVLIWRGPAPFSGVVVAFGLWRWFLWSDRV
ncbi:MAG: hypothetical protein H0X28_03575 [Solirubrobacterales bacterium]|nr:hypothetical protein [Solirubrobacterales bacterium]